MVAIRFVIPCFPRASGSGRTQAFGWDRSDGPEFEGPSRAHREIPGQGNQARRMGPEAPENADRVRLVAECLGGRLGVWHGGVRVRDGNCAPQSHRCCPPGGLAGNPDPAGNSKGITPVCPRARLRLLFFRVLLLFSR